MKVFGYLLIGTGLLLLTTSQRLNPTINKKDVLYASNVQSNETAFRYNRTLNFSNSSLQNYDWASPWKKQ